MRSVRLSGWASKSRWVRVPVGPAAAVRGSQAHPPSNNAWNTHSHSPSDAESIDASNPSEHAHAA